MSRHYFMYIEYKVIERTSQDEFETEVCYAINDGWSLVGGVCVIADSEGYIIYYCQAVIRKG